MSFSSGTFSLSAGNPVVTGTTVSSTWANNTLSDIATALSTCLLKDGTQTATASINFAQGLTVATNKLTVDSATGNTVVAGTLGTTGIATLTGGARGSGRGNTANTASATPVTLFSTTTQGLYLIACYIVGSGANYEAEAIVVSDGTTATVLHTANGANISLALSGNNIQATQTSGSAAVMRYTSLYLSP